MAVPSVERLLELAESALAGASTDQLAIDAVADYSAAFALWLAEFEKSPQEHNSLPDEELKKLQLLNEKHEKVLNLVCRLRGDTSREMRELRSKGKGLRAYVGSLPQRISVTPARKG